MSYKNAIEAGVAFSFLLSACRTVDASKPIDIASPGPTSAPLVEATPTNVILSGETIASTLKGSNISVEIGNMLSSELERIYPGMDEALSSEMRAWEYTRIEMRGDKQDAIFPGDDYVIGVDSVTGRGNMMFIEDSTGVWSLPRAGYQLKQGQVYRSIPMEYVSGANRNAEWRVQSGMSVLVRDRGRWNLALLALDPNTNRQILVPLNVIGGGGKSLFNVLMGTQEPYSGAEVTVNGEAGTIEVGGQVINTPAETKPAPTATPEPLLPPDFTVKNLKEFRTAILPYCYVNPDYSDSREGVENFYNDIKDSDFWKDLGEKFSKGEIGGRSQRVVSAGEDGGCGIITIDDLFNNQILASVFFQSKLDPNQWIEVKFTEPSR